MRGGEVIHPKHTNRISFHWLFCSAMRTNSGTSYKLVKCSATEVQPSPATSFLLVNFPFLANHYSRKRRSSFLLLMSRFTTRKFCSIHKTHMSLFIPSNCRELPWDNCNLGGETLPTLPTYSFSLFFWTWPILKRNLLLSSFVFTHQPQTICTEWWSSFSMGIWSRASNPTLVLSSEATCSWALEAGHLTPESTSLATSLVYLTFHSREWQKHIFIFSHF